MSTRDTWYWTLTKRQLCDVECLLNGAFAPLTGFLDEPDYVSVCENLRLTDGTLWAMPITLDVSESFVVQCSLGGSVVLVNDEHTPIARLTVSSIWKPNKALEAEQVFGTTDVMHPGVYYLYHEAGPWYLGGRLEALSHPLHYDFLTYRHTPQELKQLFKLYGWSRVIAFQTRNPIHRAHFELTERAAKKVQASLLLHPVVGMTKPGDIDYISRIQCYEQVMPHYSVHTMLSLLPLAMRMAGPREAVWHALIRKNYGATHFIVGRDHAGPGLNSKNQSFYGPYAAQKLLQTHQDEIGIEMVSSSEIVYVKEKAKYLSAEEVEEQDTIQTISGTALRRALKNREVLPDWFSFPGVIQTLQKAYPPKHKQGFTLFFTGLSGAGKSTLAKAVMTKLQEEKLRRVTLLDGDVVRRHLSKGLGFSKADRNTNIERVGYVASEITKHGGIAIVAAIAPYASARELARQQIMPYGDFIEIYVSTPVNVCESRDIKGLYQQAKAGLITGFTGVDDPYEAPLNPELTLDTSNLTVLDAVHQILEVLKARGLYTKEEAPAQHTMAQ